MRAKTPSFVIERKIIIHNSEEQYYLEHKFNIANQIYNKMVHFYKEVVFELYKDKWYQYSYQKMKTSLSEDEKKLWINEISVCAEQYGLREYDIHAYLGKLKNTSFQNSMNIDILQKLGSEFYASIKKAVYHKTKIHYRKYGNTNCLSAKKKNSGIIYNSKLDAVKFMGKQYRLKQVRKKDLWLHEAMNHKIKYCRIVRRTYGCKYCYFLQMVMQGVSPKKFIIGQGNCGLDEGVSTIAYSTEKETGFFVLADGIEPYEKKIKYYAVQYDRRKRMANPQCYNCDGTIKKGVKISNHTKGMKKALFYLKSAYQKKKAFIQNSHSKQINHIIGLCNHIIKEPMNFKALAKKTKGTAKRQDKISKITSKKREIKYIRKFKKKKCFGTSIQRRSPGLFNHLLEQKAKQYGIKITDIAIKKYRASQYDHVNNTYRKPGLTERAKKINNHKVQRDLYSAFLLENINTVEEPDPFKCKLNFKRFLKNQGKTVNHILKTGDTTKNFGLKYFIF